ncbi:MAG: thiamine/thiamine pyrophosphate ABC transporter permease [Parvibaculaceae bacterium]
MRASLLSGLLALGLIVGIVAAALTALLLAAGEGTGLRATLADPYLWRVARFTLLQAGLSTLLSVGFAIPVARALARRPAFPGRRLLLTLFALPLALPALVVVLGVVQVWGRNGWASALIRAAGIYAPLDVYGLTGILIAHIFFNMPLAARLLIAHLDRIPGDSWRLASQLGMPSSSIFRLIEWPALRAGLPGAALLVFMLCVASFTVVLTLGGGPSATTIEVAIYQALRFDFDPQRAVTLSLMQLVLTLAVFAVGGRFALPLAVTADLGRKGMRPDAAGLSARIGDALVIGAAGLFLLLPLGALSAAALAAPFAKLAGEPVVQRALLTSLVIAATAAILSVLLAWALVKAAAAARARPGWGWLAKAAEAGGSVVLVMPPIVIGAGLFVLLRQWADVFALAPAIVIAINALMAIPYGSRILGPALAEAAQAHDRLAQSLGIGGWSRFRLIDWPTLRKPFGLAVAFAAAVSLGDLGAIALFGSESVVTLPLLLLQRMGSYRSADAEGLAALLSLLCLCLVMAADAFGARRSARP